MAMGLLGWPPSEFWNATMHDLGAALEGWRMAQGEDKDAENAEIMELHEALIEFKRNHG